MRIVSQEIRVFEPDQFAPPKNGIVCNASIAERMRVAAWSALSAQPSMISSPKSPASGGVSFAASSAATRFTSLSSEPTTA